MFRFIFSVFLMLSATSTFAADIATPRTTVRTEYVSTQSWNSFVGIGIGSSWQKPSRFMKYDANPALGTKVGIENRNFGMSLNYDHMVHSRHSHRNVVSGMGYAQYPVYGVVPYVGAGLGYVWTNRQYSKDYPVYVIAAGLKIPVMSRLEVDASYRYMNGFKNNRATHLPMVGMNYKF